MNGRYSVPHIALPDLPGITALLAYKPATGDRLNALFQELLRGPSPLTPAERETIGAYVSRVNDCEFCARTHAATAKHLGADGDVDESGGRFGALLRLAAAVARGGKSVTEEDVAAARGAGASDEEIHDTVLIAAAFCMVNRYVDGLATVTPADQSRYDQAGGRLATQGYVATGR